MSLCVSLRHSFQKFDLAVDFTAPQGLTALFGHSGAGKTSVVDAVAGLLRPNAGRITLEDQVLLDTASGQNLPVHRRRIGYVFQDARLFPHLSVRQNLKYGAFFARGREGSTPFDQAVDMLNLSHLLNRRPSALSGGEKARVGLGRALLSAPRMLLMDEPLAALDMARRDEILPYIERLRDSAGLPILYVSHSLSEVARLATTVVVLERGRVLISGPPAEVFADLRFAGALVRTEGGAVLHARLAAPQDQDQQDGLSRLSTAAGDLMLPQIEGTPGQEVRLRVLAQDVMIAHAAPKGLSALNILPATISGASVQSQGVLVQLALAQEAGQLLAWLTLRAWRELGLHEGAQVHAVIKAMALAT